MSVSVALGNDAFQKQLAFGRMAETLIAKWLLSRGNAVLPIYDIEYETGKGPRLFSRHFMAAAPDLYCWKVNKGYWCEAKHKTVFSWYRKMNQWETGIDLNHWRDYQRVAKETGSPVWLMFLHRSSTPDPKDLRYDCPPKCPVGLFGETLDVLAKNISHESDRHGRHGMVYWAHEDLRWLATLESVLACE